MECFVSQNSHVYIYEAFTNIPKQLTPKDSRFWNCPKPFHFLMFAALLQRGILLSGGGGIKKQMASWRNNRELTLASFNLAPSPYLWLKATDIHLAYYSIIMSSRILKTTKRSFVVPSSLKILPLDFWGCLPMSFALNKITTTHCEN